MFTKGAYVQLSSPALVDAAAVCPLKNHDQFQAMGVRANQKHGTGVRKSLPHDYFMAKFAINLSHCCMLLQLNDGPSFSSAVERASMTS